MDITDLNRSISEMTDKELENHILQVRKRVTTKVRKITTKSSKVKDVPTSKSLFSSMSKIEREELLNELQSL